MLQNPADDQRGLDTVLFQGWSLALDCSSLPPVAGRDLSRLLTLDRLAGILKSEIETSEQIAQELSEKSAKRDLQAMIDEVQRIIPKASALNNAIEQMPESRHRTVLWETSQIILTCLDSAQSTASLLVDAYDDQDNLVDTSTLASSSKVVDWSIHLNSDLTPMVKQHNVTKALELVTLLLEETRQETVSTTSSNSSILNSPTTLSPSIVLAASQLHIMLQQDPGLPHRIIKEFVSTAFKSSAEPEDAADRLTMILSLFERFKDTSVQLGGVLRTASALASQAQETANAYISILKGASAPEPERPSTSKLIPIIKSNVETAAGGLERLCRLLHHSIASVSS